MRKVNYPETDRLILRTSLCMTRQCWEQGMLSYALEEILSLREEQGKEAGELGDIQSMIAYDMVLRQGEDGRLCNVEDTPSITDSAFCIPAVLGAGKRAENADWIAAAEKNAAYLAQHAPRSSDGVLYHMKDTEQIWADSAAFLPYALVITGYPREAYRQMTGILRKLYLPESSLYAHIWDETAGTFPDGRAWSVGVGWILTGLERTWRVMPETMKREREDLYRLYLELLRAVLRYQDTDGSFHDVMDEPYTFSETESTAMIACAIYMGIRDGLLTADPEMIKRAQGMAAYVDSKIWPDGRVAGASSSPAFDCPGTSVECQAHVLWLHALDRLFAR